jgi:hypothetical protein
VLDGLCFDHLSFEVPTMESDMPKGRKAAMDNAVEQLKVLLPQLLPAFQAFLAEESNEPEHGGEGAAAAAPAQGGEAAAAGAEGGATAGTENEGDGGAEMNGEEGAAATDPNVARKAVKPLLLLRLQAQRVVLVQPLAVAKASQRSSATSKLSWRN